MLCCGSFGRAIESLGGLAHSAAGSRALGAVPPAPSPLATVLGKRATDAKGDGAEGTAGGAFVKLNVDALMYELHDLMA